MPDNLINPILSISESSKLILNEMLKDVPENTANATLTFTRDGTKTITMATKFGIGEDSRWIIGVGVYHQMEAEGGDKVTGAAISINW